MSNREPYYFSAVIVHETPDAYLLDCGQVEHFWFPKSQTTDNGDGTFTCPQWLAEKKEIV